MESITWKSITACIRSSKMSKNSFSGSLGHLNLLQPLFSYWKIFSSYFSDYVDFTRDELIWREDRLTYGYWEDGPKKDSIFSTKFNLDLENSYNFVRNNGSLYLHTFFFPTGESMYLIIFSYLKYAKNSHVSKHQISIWDREKHIYFVSGLRRVFMRWACKGTN